MSLCMVLGERQVSLFSVRGGVHVGVSKIHMVGFFLELQRGIKLSITWTTVKSSNPVNGLNGSHITKVSESSTFTATKIHLQPPQL